METDLTGDEDTDSPLASPSGAKKLKFEEEIKSDLNDIKQCLQHLEKRSMIEDEIKHAFECTICKQVVRQPVTSGCCQCLVRCKDCLDMWSTSTHTIRHEFKCTTRNLVYLIRCRRCGLQYVGEMGNPLHTRMNSQQLRHQDRKDRQTSCGLLHSARPLTGRPAGYGDTEILPRRYNPKETP